jgi:endo-1,4-beta-xylanase
LIERVWDGRDTSPETITQRIKLLRDAIGDVAAQPNYIALVRREGYRLIPEVRAGDDGEPVLANIYQPRPVRRLAGVVATLATVGVLAAFWFGRLHSTSDPQPLKDVFKDAFLVGASLKHAQISGEDERAVSLVKTHFNTITPENVMKWERIHPEPEKYDFAAADRFVEFGERNGMFIVGHTLIWHDQTPQWVFENENAEPLGREALLQRMREHIDTVVSRYKGQVDGWEVVNAALNENGTLRESRWYNIIGEDYVEMAFRYANEADPDAQLYYNDYSLEQPAKRAGAVRLIKSLQKKGVSITGVGTRGSSRLGYPAVKELENTITAFGRLGLDVMITALDIDVLPVAFDYEDVDLSGKAELREQLDPYPYQLPASMQRRQAEQYRDLFELFLNHRDVITRVTFWGVTDADSWQNNWPVQGRTNYPLLFDREGRPKPAFHYVVERAREMLQ